jgi:gliding motility-associated-like protein
LKRIGICICVFILFALWAGKINAQYIDTVCLGDTGVRYYTAAKQGSVFAWKVEGGSIARSSADGSQIWVNWGLSGGKKTITVKETNSNGCIGKEVDAKVLVRPEGPVEIIGPEAICKGEIAELKAKGADSYIWSTGATTDRLLVQPEFDTTYFVTGYFGECKTSTSLHDLQVKYRPKADFEFEPIKPLIGATIQFTYTGTTNVDFWNWRFTQPVLQEQTSQQINPQYIAQQAGIVTAHLQVSNKLGCVDTVTKYIPVKTGINVFSPNAFTPNDDGLNNVFLPTYENVKGVLFTVYDRWGETLFKTNQLTEGWDGRYKGVPVPEGVFVYVIEAVGFDNNKYIYNGTITVLR